MRAGLFFVPYWLSFTFSGNLDTQYWICWLGSLWIFFLTFTGIVTPLPKDRPFTGQFMRPFIFAHIILASYMALTSVFYFFAAKGYYYWDKVTTADRQLVTQIVTCQQYYVLAHAALATGLTLWLRDFGKGPYPVQIRIPLLEFYYRLTLVSFVCSFALGFIPIGTAIRNGFSLLFLYASLLFLTTALREKKWVFPALALFGFNLAQGLLSGMKANTLIIIIFLGITYFERYRWKVIPPAALALYVWFAVVPTLSYFIRQEAWFGRGTSSQSVSSTFQKIQSGQIDTRRINWNMLAYRTSEINMFIRYTEFVPKKHNFYGLEIVNNALWGLVPKAFRPDGKSIDETAMQRVYDAGVIIKSWSRGTSAKPAMIADAYMSGGPPFIVAVFLIFGFLAVRFAVFCERIMGGYTLGTVLVFNSCFGIFQINTCFENIPSAIFYGYVLTYILYFLFIELKYIRSNSIPSNSSLSNA